ncbi:MAG TPA: pimeloyl-CoA dehydrogenase large subunit, partial [Cupriavidus sp.]|nr:pimeloyl-CoA dehydrogenase large subunit [Cupriavidus sp.]
MDLNYSAADIAFRQEVRSWLEANLPAEIREKVLNHRRPNRD